MNRQSASLPIKTGFIGLGNQGSPMAARMLEAGYPLTVWARRQPVAQEFARKGAVAASSIVEVGAASDHVGICVFGDADVFEVCEPLIPAMRAGSVLVIHSTIHPDSCVQLAARCAQRGILFIDAPVSGGAHAAEQGALTVMCGGDQAAFERALPVMETFGRRIVLLGQIGAGQRAKLINNALMSANMGLAQAALAAGSTLGLDRAALADVINHSSGRSLGFEIYARMRSYADFAVGTPVMIKDVALLCDLLDDENTETLRQAADFFLKPAGEAQQG